MEETPVGEPVAVCDECERSVANHWDLIQAMARRGPQYLREALALAGDDQTVLTVTNEELQYAWGEYEGMKADRDLALRERGDAQDEIQRLRSALQEIAVIGGGPEIGVSCHWHIEAAQIAQDALDVSTSARGTEQ